MRVFRSFFFQKSLLIFLLFFNQTPNKYCAPLFVGMSTTDTNQLFKLQSRVHQLVCSPNCACDLFAEIEERRSLLSQNFLREVMDPDHILTADLLHSPELNVLFFRLIEHKDTVELLSYLLARSLMNASRDSPVLYEVFFSFFSLSIMFPHCIERFSFLSNKRSYYYYYERTHMLHSSNAKNLM